jgi:hypothetical protein
LVCPEAIQRDRLLARPAWRQAGSPEFVAQACGFSRLLERLGREPTSGLTVVDTAAEATERSAERIAAWARGA